jgi:hypothetical protein
MNMYSRNQYLKKLREEYLSAISRKDKTKMLDEAVKRTELNRAYLIEKLRPKSNLDSLQTERKKRARHYGHDVAAALATAWEIFDRPCGQRLAQLLRHEVDRLRNLHELCCADIVATKLKTISPRTIDTALTHHKADIGLGEKYRHVHPLLYQKVPVKVFADQDRDNSGNIQVDCVEHCGVSASGTFIYSVSMTDIAHGWWEGDAVMGKGQEGVCAGIDAGQKRFPFPWNEMHTDNGTEFMNAHLARYCAKHDILLSRSRPYKKNDNCLVEQKNWTHVRKKVGYLRYDTPEEQRILNSLYRGELRLFKNFFQPVMKLVSKERIGGRIKRTYDVPKTPYQRVMDAADVPDATKFALEKTYRSLNPAELKRKIIAKLDALYDAYQKKNNSPRVDVSKKIHPSSIRFYFAERGVVRSDS